MAIAIPTKTIHCMKQRLQPFGHRMVKLCRFAFATIILIFCFQTYTHAADVTLQWNANTESDLAGYKIYYGNYSGSPYDGADAGQGVSPIILALRDFKDPDKPEFTITDLDADEVYYFAVTAYDADSLESDFSNEVSTDGVSYRGGDGLVLEAASGGGGGCFIQSTAELIINHVKEPSKK